MEDEIIDSTVEDVAQPEQSPAPEKTMDDTIRETLAAIEARGSEDPTEQSAGRARDEQGRFAAKDAAPEQTPELGTSPAEAQPDPVAAPITVPPEIQRLGLRKDEAEAFAAAPEAVRNAFLRRSEEMHKGLEQYRSKAQFGAQVEQAVAPYMATIQSMGAHPAQAISTLMAADHALRYGTPQQKQGMAMKILQDYGIDLGQGSYEPAQVDPNVSALQQQVQQLQGWIQQQHQAVEMRERETLNSEVARFAKDPANKHFEAVKLQMAGLLQAGAAQTLQEAYDAAIYANPQVRAAVLAEQQAAADAKRKADAAQKAQDAKRAAAVNLSRRGVVATKAPIGTMDDTIRQAAERLGMI